MCYTYTENHECWIKYCKKHYQLYVSAKSVCSAIRAIQFICLWVFTGLCIANIGPLDGVHVVCTFAGLRVHSPGGHRQVPWGTYWGGGGGGGHRQVPWGTYWRGGGDIVRSPGGHTGGGGIIRSPGGHHNTLASKQVCSHHKQKADPVPRPLGG